MNGHPVSPHSLRLRAAELAGSVLLETSQHSKDAQTWLFTQPEEVITAAHPHELEGLFAALEQALEQNYYVAGFFSYEAGQAMEPALRHLPYKASTLPLAWFGVYREPLVVSTTLDTTQTAATLSTTLSPELELKQPEYTDKVQMIRSLIESGDTYQANLTTQVRWKEDRSPADLFRQMMQAQPVEFGALLNLGDTQILSASPELFFKRKSDWIQTRPMKGTAPRGRTTEEDVQRANWLRNDEKNRSENLMIVDLLRNDLGRICKIGSVGVKNLFQIEAYPTLFQMTSTIEGTLQPYIGWKQIFQALFPSGSIVGAPKIRTMEIVHELEPQARGVYTGAIGYITPQNRAIFSVAIRTVVLNQAQASMGVGSGIVYDSDPSLEYQECLTKTSFLTRDTAEFQLIETLLWDGRYTFLSEHLQRLAKSASYFGFSCDTQQIVEALHTFSCRFGCSGRQRVRLLLYRDGNTTMEASNLPEDSVAPLRVLLQKQPTSSDDAFLFHKTTRRDRYQQALQQAQEHACHEAIFQNEHGHVTEGTVHNLFLVKDGTWLTPALTSGLLPGVYREHVMKTREASEAVIPLEQLLQADEIYLCNAVRGMRKVSGLLRCNEDGKLVSIWQSQRQSEHVPNIKH